MDMSQILNKDVCPVNQPEFRESCKRQIVENGVLVLPDFVRPEAIAAIASEGEKARDKVFAQTSQHSVYLASANSEYGADHALNRMVTSSKGCLTDDYIPGDSPLQTLYDSAQFQDFLCEILTEQELFEYADPLSSINLHFAETGQELGWHFDNSSFAITLMIQSATAGSRFEYVKNLRDADAGEMNFDGVKDVLDGRTKPQTLTAEAGTLVVFRGRNSLHRVTPNAGVRTRMLAVLAYNSEPGIALAEEARQIFYGRTGE